MKRQNQLNIKRGLLSKLVLLVALFLGSSNAWGDELVVTSTTSKTYTANVPIAGNLLNSTLIQSEFIIPKEKIVGLKNKRITKLALTVATKASSNWGDAVFKVFLKETDTANYGTTTPWSLIGDEGATTVYTGGLDPTKSSIDITFTTPFDYTSGKNLLVGIYCTHTGTANDISFKLIRDNSSDYTNYSGYINNSGALTRTNWYPETTFTYQDIVVVTPKLDVSPTSVSFGTMKASGSETITVSNTGVGTMDVTISNSNTTDFTVSTTSLTGIGEGQSKTFDVTFNYNGESLGGKSTTITVTPSYDAGDAKGIDVTATAANASIWASFEDGIPTTWDNQNNSWLNYVSGFSGWANPGYMSSDYLRTPRLYAEAGQSIEFDVKYGGATASYKVKAEYSTDRINWTTIGTYTKTDEDIETKSFEAPATGYYWLRFSAYQCGINNFVGWAIADNTHDVALGSKSIPTTGITHGDYTATVNVLERGGTGETLTAELYVDDVKVAEETNFTIGGNRDKTISLTYTPIETGTKQVYIKVYGENIDALETAKVNVTFNEPSFILDEESDTHPTSTVSTTIKLKYTAKAGWNTIVMPFALTQAQLNTIFGPDNTVYVIKSCEDGTLTFTKQDVYAVSMPYLVYAPNAVPNAEGIYLQNVAVYSYAWTWENLTQTKGDATFQGTFTPIAAPGMNGKYGITDAGKLGKGNALASIKGYRAYLEVTNGELARIMTIDSEGETTDLGFVRMVDQEAKDVYNLQGQKVAKGRKGIYIVNGKKVVIK